MPSGGETKAATRMSGRQQAPALNENTYMHVTKILRHFGYGAEDIAAYVKTLPQPKARADKAAKLAKKGAATAAEAPVEPHPTSAPAAATAPPASKGKASKATPTGTGAAGGKGQTGTANQVKQGHASIQPRATGAAGGTPHGGAASAAMDAAETLAASDANVIGMISDDDDLLPVAVTARAPPPRGMDLTGGKRKAGELAASEQPQQGAPGCRP